MSLLVIQLPPRDRLGSRGGAADSASGHRLPTEWPYTYSADGRVPGASGHAPAALLPKADQCVLVLADADVSWHLVDVPKAPAGKLRDALAGVMEESLLEESEALHFALAADAGGRRMGGHHRPRPTGCRLGRARSSRPGHRAGRARAGAIRAGRSWRWRRKAVAQWLEARPLPQGRRL
jgi:hypothetical protein